MPRLKEGCGWCEVYIWYSRRTHEHVAPDTIHVPCLIAEYVQLRRPALQVARRLGFGGYCGTLSVCLRLLLT